MVEIFKALGDETRLRIINLLLQRELCVCDIEGILEISQSNASRHLLKLKSCGIITQEKKAQWVFHRIDEKFKKEHQNLIKYLQEQTLVSERYTVDANKLQGYKVTCLSTEEWCK